MNPINALLASLIAVTSVYAVGFGRAIVSARRRPKTDHSSPFDARFPTPVQLFIGAITNFFDTLGIGSFAPTTAMFRLWKVVNDRVIPGTLNVGHTLNSTLQTFIFTAIIPVDPVTLFSMIGAAILGAWLGAGIVARWPKRKVQIGMGTALTVAATLMFMTQMSMLPGGGQAIGISGVRLALALAGNFMLGALMTLGIGLYAPCMIMISLLGMDPRAAFPIMMGSCAFLMPVGSLRFIREQSYAMRASLGLFIGGLPAVLLGAYVVKELPLTAVRWVIMAVVLYTAATMLWSALSEKDVVAAERARVEA
jgi:uncharacterized membrane protein YfcA